MSTQMQSHVTWIRAQFMSKVAVQTQHNSYMNKRYVLSGIVFVDKKCLEYSRTETKLKKTRFVGP